MHLRASEIITNYRARMSQVLKSLQVSKLLTEGMTRHTFICSFCDSSYPPKKVQTKLFLISC